MSLTVCTYNIENFNKCFTETNDLDEDTSLEYEIDGDTVDTGDKLDAVATILRAIDADLVGLVEAPATVTDARQSTVAALERFSDAYDIPQTAASMGYQAPGTQELAVVFNESTIESVDHISRDGTDSATPPFDGEFITDTDRDGIEEIHDFYRPPFEAEVSLADSGQTFRLILGHVKSKSTYGIADRLYREREALANRRKIFAQCMWIRNRVEELIQEHSVVVMGDFNDGPGFDQYERRFGRTGIEIVIGDLFQPGKILRSAYGRPTWDGEGWDPYTARFYNDWGVDEVPIDYVLATEDLTTGRGQVWNTDEHPDLSTSLEIASDHFPVSMELDVA